MAKSRLLEKGYSNKQLKQMVHGVSPIAEVCGNLLVLTRVGEKVASIARPDGRSATAPVP
jgi:hypothetical protein